MAGKDIIMLSAKELKRLKIIQAILDSKMMQAEGAKILGLTARRFAGLLNWLRKRVIRGFVIVPVVRVQITGNR